MVGDEEQLGHARQVLHVAEATPHRVGQIGVARRQPVVHVDGGVILQAQQDAVRNGRHDEVEAEYDDGDVVRDLVHRQSRRVLQVE